MPSPFYLFGGVSRVNIPHEFANEADFLKYLGVSTNELKKIWWFRGRMYAHFDISKKSGKARYISAPDDRLKSLQRKIAISLSKIYRPRAPVHGFVLDRSVKTNAITHMRRRFLFNIDIKDFFPSIFESRVNGLLISIGIDIRVSSIVARICCNNGCLPQGAPSSPIISNMVCFRLDKALMEFAKEHKLLYTRYADDISFSGFQPPSAVFEGGRGIAGKVSVENVSKRLRDILLENGFEPNPDKIHYADKTSRRKVTGLKINEGINLDRNYIRNIRATLYKIERFGVAAAQAELSSRLGRACGIGAHLRGKISWVGFTKGQADPVFRGLAKRYNASFPEHAVRIHPTKEEILDRSVWVLESESNTGTAFFLKNIGLITAAHCVKDAVKIEIFHPSKISNRFSVSIAHMCTYRDLAILSHAIPSTDYFELEEFAGSPTMRADTVAAGFPSYGPGDKLNLRPGTVSSLTVKHAVKLIEVTQKLSQGMSGGPLMSEDNRVMGIIHKGGPTEPRDFAVNLSELKSWVVKIS